MDLLLLGDLGERDQRRARQHIDVCPSCRARYGARQSGAEQFDRRVYPRTREHVARELGSTSWLPGRRKSRRWVPVVGALAAAAAAAALFVHRPVTRSEGVQGDLLEKGGPSLTVYARRQGRLSVVTDGARLDPGDALRFTADPGASEYLLIASVDAALHVTIYVPHDQARSAPVKAHQRFEDGSSFVLDDTRGPERIFALFSTRPLEAAAVTRALSEIGGRGTDEIRRRSRLPVDAESQVSLLIEKTAP